MELPVIRIPKFIDELSSDFSSLFPQHRQMKQFQRLLTGFILSEKHSIAHMNGIFMEHTNQSNLNRFITSQCWNVNDVNAIKISMINRVENEGIVVIDDYITQKYGKSLYGTDWHYDHAEGRNVFGQQIADCVFSGDGIYPLFSSVYVKKNSRWSGNDFKTKIELQMEHITQLVNMELNFSTVAMDIWYFCKKMVDHLNSLGKDWVAQCKSNRLIQSDRKWISLNDFASEQINKTSFRVIQLADEKYFMKAFSVNMKGIGTVRLLISTKGGNDFKFYVSNRLDWNELAITSHYARRWDIEVWHREGKGSYGLKECGLRSGEAVSRYLTLSALAHNLLEIASRISPLYATLKKRACTPGLKQRWVILELVSQLISLAAKMGDRITKKIADGILLPYRSTMNRRITDY